MSDDTTPTRYFFRMWFDFAQGINDQDSTLYYERLKFDGGNWISAPPDDTDPQGNKVYSFALDDKVGYHLSHIGNEKINAVYTQLDFANNQDPRNPYERHAGDRQRNAFILSSSDQSSTPIAHPEVKQGWFLSSRYDDTREVEPTLGLDGTYEMSVRVRAAVLYKPIRYFSFDPKWRVGTGVPFKPPEDPV